MTFSSGCDNYAVVNLLNQYCLLFIHIILTWKCNLCHCHRDRITYFLKLQEILVVLSMLLSLLILFSYKTYLILILTKS